ncbi:MAG: hypothetical protein ABIL25_08800 [candidate division WOR-3 bacterium]
MPYMGVIWQMVCKAVWVDVTIMVFLVVSPAVRVIVLQVAFLAASLISSQAVG